MAHLAIQILDVNDNPPEFASKFYFASVREDVPVNSDVVRVLATSKDSGINADMTYSIISGNEHRKFKINPKTGVIATNSSRLTRATDRSRSPAPLIGK
jgi:protocadherin Fat 1/2/3